MILLIDATATDDQGNIASASVAVTVNVPPAAEKPPASPPEDPFGIHQTMVMWRTVL